MSKYQTVRALKKEINKVNREIDSRIIQRRPYADLALYHKSLMVQMRRATISRPSMFSRFITRCASFTL